MNQPSSRYLTHDFVVYQDLTLKELLTTGIAGMLLTCGVFIVIGFCVGWPGVCLALGAIVGFLLSIRVLPKIVSKIKQGKPCGYLRKTMITNLSAWGLMKSPYLKHEGVWRKERLIGEKHV